MATDYWNQSIFTRKKHHGQIMTVPISRRNLPKTVLITMITSFGLAPGGYSDDIQCQLTMADLFR